jgi:hypothetical protein
MFIGTLRGIAILGCLGVFSNVLRLVFSANGPRGGGQY